MCRPAELEFDGISINSMDATGQRDFVGTIPSATAVSPSLAFDLI